MIRRAAVLALLSCLLLGCTVFEAVVPAQGEAGFLTIEVRSGRSIDVRVGTKNLAHLDCGTSITMTPGERQRGTSVIELPPLPWDVKIVSNRDVRWTGTVSDLPLWVLVTADGVALSDQPPVGPMGPACPGL